MKIIFLYIIYFPRQIFAHFSQNDWENVNFFPMKQLIWIVRIRIFRHGILLCIADSD